MYKKLIFLFIVVPILAGTTGKIRGVITDSQTNDPLIGCNVFLMSTDYGSSADIDGNYMILNVPPGLYELHVSMIGYDKFIMKNVEVNSDLTTTINTSLNQSSLEIESVIVNAAPKLINKNLTSTTAIVTKETISKLPVNEVSEILNLQAGFVDGHLRGGRTGEIAYWVDGIPVTDQYDGNTVVDVSKDMIQEMQLISGAFNAEYGQAMSGILNIVTKEGTEDFGGSFDIYSGDFLSSSNDVFMNIDSFSPLTTKNITMNFHGRILKNFYYYVNIRNIYYQGVFEGKKIYNPESYGVTMNNELGDEVFHILGTNSFLDSLFNNQTMQSRLMDTSDEALVNQMYNSLLQAHSNPLGDGQYVSMDWNEKKYVQLNTIWKINDKTKLKFSIINDDVEYQDYDRMYKYNPDGNLIKNRFGLTSLLQLKKILNETSFFTLGVTDFNKEYKHSAFDELGLYVHDQMDDLVDGYSFYVGGSNNSKFKRYTDTQTLKFDYTNQVDSDNMIKLGFETRTHSVYYQDIYLQPPIDMINIDPIYESAYLGSPRILHDSTIYYSEYQFSPVEFSFYIQDKIEMNELIMNAGLRFDYFDSKGLVLTDPRDPFIYNPLLAEHQYDCTNNDGYCGDDELEQTIEERMKYWYTPTTSKSMFSPRIGGSFPISDQGVFHFSYGHFYQMPTMRNLFLTSIFGAGLSPSIGYGNLKPQKTVMYEFGLQQQLSRFLAINGSIFFKDIRDLLALQSISYVSPTYGPSSYAVYLNKDYSMVQGITLSLTKRRDPKTKLSAFLDYSFQTTEGNSVTSGSFYYNSLTGVEEEKKIVPLSWDQSHVFNATISITEPGSNGWGLSFIGKMSSGWPYTPNIPFAGYVPLPNSSRKPIQRNIDMRIYKLVSLAGFNFELFLKVYNVLDTRNERYVFTDTGRAEYTFVNRSQEETEGFKNHYGEPGVHTWDEYNTRPDYFGPPRLITIGWSINL